MVRKNLVFDFRHGVYAEAVGDISAVEALNFTWAWDEAPTMELRISNPGGRRENFFTPHSTWHAYIGLGALPASPTFIGYQSPYDAPEYDEDTLRLTVYGYTARMREMQVAVDASSWAGYDAMAAIKDNFDSMGTSYLTTGGLCGATTPSAVPTGAISSKAAVMDRTSIIKKLLPYALDTTNPDRPLPLHYLEAPNGTVATAKQVTELDPTSTSPAVSAVLTQGTDFYRIRKQWDNTFFTKAFYKNGSGFAEVDYGANGMVGVHPPKEQVFDDFESARRAVQLARLPHFTYEVDLATHAGMALCPGDIIQITGSKGTADGYHQIAELRMNFQRKVFGITARLAKKAPL